VEWLVLDDQSTDHRSVGVNRACRQQRAPALTNLDRHFEKRREP
jgi:hypothetical protein